MQIQPYNGRIQLSLSTIAFTDNKERAAGMNLKEVYEIFYPGKCGKLPSVWKVPPKYRSKKEFFEELLPIEIRWLNYKIWNDKAIIIFLISQASGFILNNELRLPTFLGIKGVAAYKT